MKKTCLDAFNPIYVGESRANQFDRFLFYETLVTNNKVVLTNNHFLDCIELSRGDLPSLFRLLDKKMKYQFSVILFQSVILNILKKM